MKNKIQLVSVGAFHERACNDKSQQIIFDDTILSRLLFINRKRWNQTSNSEERCTRS